MADRIAYYYIADEKGFQIVVARESGGYSPMKEDGDPDPRTRELRDPFYLAPRPVWFATQQEARDEADWRNTDELGLTERDAAVIIAHSMRMVRS